MHQVLFGADPLFSVPAAATSPGLDSLPVVRPARPGLRAGRLRDRPGPVPLRSRLPAAAGRRVLAPGHRRGRLRPGRAGRAPCPRRRLRRDRRRPPARMALTAVAALAGAKLLAWWIALASGTSGGTLAPILLISAGFGSLFGAAVEHVAPGLGVSATACALVAMAAVFGSATRASFTGIVFVFELTRDYEAVVPLMVASGARRASSPPRCMSESLMTEKLARRGLRVANHYEVDALTTASVRQIMSAPVRTVGADATRRRGPGGHHQRRAQRLPGGRRARTRCVGMVIAGRPARARRAGGRPDRRPRRAATSSRSGPTRWPATPSTSCSRKTSTTCRSSTTGAWSAS